MVGEVATSFDLKQSKGRYFIVTAPDGSVLSQHTELAYAQEAVLKHALANEIDGKYLIDRNASWEITTVGFGAKSLNPGDVLPPSAPSGVTAVLSGNNQITVTWGASTDPSGVANYLISLVGGSVENSVLVASPRSIVFSGLLAGASYTYQVSAVDIYGNRSLPTRSGPVTVPVPASFDWTVPDGHPVSLTAGGASLPLPSILSNPQSVPLAYSGSSLPANVTVNPTTGALTAAAGAAPVTGLSIVVGADDGIISSGGIASTTQIIPFTPITKPAPLTSFTDPNFGTTIHRLIDPSTLENETSVGPNYSTQQHWNSDETLMILYGNSGAPYVVDAVYPYTLRTGRLGAPYPAYAYSGTWKWSPTSPRDLYYFGTTHSTGVTGVNWGAFTPHDGAVLVKVTLTTNFSQTRTVVASWPGYWADKNPCSEEMKVSFTGKLWVGVCLRDTQAENVPNVTRYYAFAHNVTDNVSTAMLDCHATAGTYEYPVGSGNFFCRVPDIVVPTPACDAVIIGWGEGFNTRYRGWEKYSLVAAGGNLNTGFIKQIAPLVGHSDNFMDQSGFSWIVYADRYTGQIARARIDGSAIDIVQASPSPSYFVSSGGQHVGARQNNQTKSFAAVSEYSVAGGAWVAMRDEIYLVYSDSTIAVPHILRLCHHRGVYNGSYGSSPFGTINRSGTKILFGSNWGGTTGDAYIVEIPS